MRREISEVKPVETKSRENYLDSSVRKAFERLQEGKTARAENKLDSSVRKSFEKLESHSTYEKRLQQKMENPEKDLQKLVGEYLNSPVFDFDTKYRAVSLILILYFVLSSNILTPYLVACRLFVA